MRHLTREQFVARYGGIYEQSPWVAERAFERLATDEPRELQRALADAVDSADRDARLALIRAHPDLAGSAAFRGELTAASTDEQRSAGIDRCTPDELRRFEALNEAYKARFGFPFVMAVRDKQRSEILAAFSERLQNDRETEFDTAIAEIHKIARLRLAASADPEPAAR